MSEVDLLGPEPIYKQIAAVLKARIEDGTYPPRRAIPSEAALSTEFGVARPTVRAALRLLAEQGLIMAVRGKGTFVRQPEDGAE